MLYRFFGPLVELEMKKVAHNVTRSEIFEKCGHSLAWEAEDRLAAILTEFMLGK